MNYLICCLFFFGYVVLVYHVRARAHFEGGYVGVQVIVRFVFKFVFFHVCDFGLMMLFELWCADVIEIAMEILF